MLIASFFIFFYFIANQKKKLRQNKTPLINMDLFKIKDFNLGLISVLFYFMMHTAYLLFVTVYFQNGLGFSAYQSGLFFVAFGICFTISSFSSIRLVALYGKKIIQFGIFIILISYILQLCFFRVGEHEAVIYGLMSLNGFGAGLVLPSLMNITLKSIPKHFIGAASGIYSTVQQASSALGVSVIGGVFFFIIEDHSGAFRQAYNLSMYAEILCIIIVGIVIFKISDLKK
jgi:predicted MFS family arabinose efflux permease